MADLVLLPTAFEREQIASRLQPVVERHGWRVELCGFGPIVAAARSVQLIARHQPRRLILLGIAGSFIGDDALATACRFDGVVSYGVGVGEGDDFIPASRLGWPQWRDDEPSRCIEETIWLTESAQRQSPPQVLLTCCAGAATADEAARRRRLFPQATAEDMEGFGVAAACRLADVPLQIVRGMSNLAGDRDHRHWHTTAALQAAAELVCEMIGCP